MIQNKFRMGESSILYRAWPEVFAMSSDYRIEALTSALAIPEHAIPARSANTQRSRTHCTTPSSAIWRRRRRQRILNLEDAPPLPSQAVSRRCRLQRTGRWVREGPLALVILRLGKLDESRVQRLARSVTCLDAGPMRGFVI
jgi:hypothetical protein